MLFRAAALLSLSLAAGCASAGPRAGSTAPVIDHIEPTSGRAGIAYPIEVTVVGRNFTDSNVVTFGHITLRPVGSRDSGTRITFHVPKQTPSQGEVPPAPLLPDAYEVRIATAGGTSNAATFTLTPEQSER